MALTIKTFCIHAGSEAFGLLHEVPQHVEWNQQFIYKSVVANLGGGPKQACQTMLSIRTVAPNGDGILRWVVALTTKNTGFEFIPLMIEIMRCVEHLFIDRGVMTTMTMDVVGNCPQFVVRTKELEALAALAASQAIEKVSAQAKSLDEAMAREIRRKRKALEKAEAEADAEDVTLAEMMQLCCA